MSKKYKNGTIGANELSVADEANELIVSSEQEEIEKYTLESSRDKLLKKVNETEDAEEQRRLIENLAEINKIINDNKTVDKKDEQFEKEMALHKEELKQNKRNTFWGVVGQFGAIALSMLGYGYLSYRQTQWEMEGNAPATTPGKEMARGASRLLRFGKN